MAFIIATSRNTGDLITADIWNQDVVDNPNFLKGVAGQIVFDDGASFPGAVIPILDNTHPLGTDSLRWSELVVSERIQVGGYRVANRREEQVNWEDDNINSYQNDFTTFGSGGSILIGGSGQIVLKVDNDGAGGARIDQRLLVNAAASNLWTPSKNPYYRLELHLDLGGDEISVFVGLRISPANAIPTAGEEHVGFTHGDPAGLWRTSSSDGVGVESEDVDTEITLGARHILEFFQTASKIEFWVDGVLLQTHTVEFPTSALTWEIFLESDGSGGATDTHLTIGQYIVQEDTP